MALQPRFTGLKPGVNEMFGLGAASHEANDTPPLSFKTRPQREAESVYGVNPTFLGRFKRALDYARAS